MIINYTIPAMFWQGNKHLRIHWRSQLSSTIISQVPFAHFRTVKPISKKSAFYLWRHSCSKKVPVEKESSLFRGGAITFLTLFPQDYIHWQQHTMRRSIDQYSHSKKEIFLQYQGIISIKSGERVNFLSHFFLLQLMMSEESFIWSEYTQL